MEAKLAWHTDRRNFHSHANRGGPALGATDPYPKRIDGQEAGPGTHVAFTGFVIISGCPGISIPCDPSPNGLPIGVQLVAAEARPWPDLAPLPSIDSSHERNSRGSVSLFAREFEKKAEIEDEDEHEND
jgi:hypothetical protein